MNNINRNNQEVLLWYTAGVGSGVGRGGGRGSNLNGHNGGFTQNAISGLIKIYLGCFSKIDSQPPACVVPAEVMIERAHD